MGNDCSSKPRSLITQRIMKEFASDEERNFDMGKMLEGRFEYQQASYYYLQVIKQNPNSAIAYYGVGNCLLKTGDIRAQQYYQLAIDCDPKCKFAYNGLGIFYEKAHNDQQAKFNLKKSIEIDPEFAFPYNNLGNMYYRQKIMKKRLVFTKPRKDLCLTVLSFQPTLLAARWTWARLKKLQLLLRKPKTC